MKLPVDPDESRLVLGMKDFAPFFIYKKDDLYKVLHYKQAASGGIWPTNYWLIQVCD